MSCCGGQPLAYLGREVADGRDVDSWAQDTNQVADVADAAGRGEAYGQVQGLPPDDRRLHWLVLRRVCGGEQGEVESPAADVAAIHVQ